MNEKGLIVIYNTPENGVKVEAKLVDDNVWMTQEQIVKLYQSSKSNISEHIKHILEEGELEEDSVVRNFRTTASDGKNYNVKHYNLDMILAVGYRVRSNIGTNFRKGAGTRQKRVRRFQRKTLYRSHRKRKGGFGPFRATAAHWEGRER